MIPIVVDLIAGRQLTESEAAAWLARRPKWRVERRGVQWWWVRV